MTVDEKENNGTDTLKAFILKDSITASFSVPEVLLKFLIKN